MELGLILLAGAVVIAAFVLALTLRRPAAAPRHGPTRGLTRLLVAQGEIAGPVPATRSRPRPSCSARCRSASTRLSNRSGRELSQARAPTKTSATLGGIGRPGSTSSTKAQKNISRVVGAMSWRCRTGAVRTSRRAAPSARSRMEAIIADASRLSASTNSSTRCRTARGPDCIIRLPNVKAVVVVDSEISRSNAFTALKQPLRAMPRA